MKAKRFIPVHSVYEVPPHISVQHGFYPNLDISIATVPGLQGSVSEQTLRPSINKITAYPLTVEAIFHVAVGESVMILLLGNSARRVHLHAENRPSYF